MHWYGVRPWELDRLTAGEIEVMVSRLKKAPPIGGVMQYEPAGSKRR